MFCYYHYVVVVLVATQYLRRKRLCIFSLTKLLATLIFTISTSSFSQKKNTHNILRQSACFKSNDLQTNTHIHTHTQRLQGSDVSYGEGGLCRLMFVWLQVHKHLQDPKKGQQKRRSSRKKTTSRPY